MTIADEIENEARAAYNASSGIAERYVNGYGIRCTIISAMINRGMATGDTKRATWYIDGKRASRSKVDRIVAMGSE